MPTQAETPIARFLKVVAKVEPRETGIVLAAFFLYFFVLGSYFALRPVRETFGILIGREEVADLWLWTAVFSIALIPLWGWLVGRVNRSILLPCVYGTVAIIALAIALYIGAAEPTVAVAKFYYVWVSVFNLMLTSIFWSFLLEMLTTEQTKRLFGFVAAGGTLGALVGPIVTRFSVEHIGNSGVMMVAAAGFVCAIFCQRILLTLWKRGEVAPATSTEVKSDKAIGGNPFAGIAIVLKSPYLLGIASFIVLLSAANTFLYFEQLRLVAETFTDREEQTQVFANIDIVVQSLTIFTQFFLTGRIAKAFGVKALLTALPIVIMFAFIGLAMFNVFAVLVVAMVARRWGEYALIRPGREMLFSPLDKATKYKAKNFIDVPVYRAADYVGGQAKTALDAVVSTPAITALVAAGLAGLWAVNGYLLGRKHDAGGTAEAVRRGG